jgi:predicted metal-dependent HD superfamily phosphohydrolase
VSAQPRDVESLRTNLAARWSNLIRGYDDVGDDLIARYADPSRRYHDLEHLAEVLEHLDRLEGEADDPLVVRLAGWFHDAVYVVTATDNEEQSARLAESVLGALDLAPSRVAEVARLVRLTASHVVDPGDRDGGTLCDADLAILASPSERYRRYTEAVRREYAQIPDDAFRSGRASILRRLLELPNLFSTTYGSRHWEAAARVNIQRELDDLVR